jgi:hypothetical protein
MKLLRQSYERVRWKLMARASGFGVAGATGIALLLASAWIWLVDIPRASSEFEEQLRLVEASRDIPPTNAESPREFDPAAASQLTRSVASANQLPSEITIRLKKSGFDIAEVSVHEAAPGASGVRSFDLAISGRSTYRALKRCLGDLLERYPTLALNQISLSATESSIANEAIVDARFRLRYFFLADR